MYTYVCVCVYVCIMYVFSAININWINAIAQQILLQFCSNKFRENCVRQIETSIVTFYSREGSQNNANVCMHIRTYISQFCNRARTYLESANIRGTVSADVFFALECSVGEIMAQRHDCHPCSFTPLRGIARWSNKRSVILVNRA